MDVKTAIGMRKSIRHFTDKKVSKEEVLEILDAGRLAPSGKNSQNWHFVAITNDKIKNEIADVIRAKNKEICDALAKINPGKSSGFSKFLEKFTVFFVHAPVLIVVMAKEYKPTGYDEYKIIDDSHPMLEELVHLKSPGMQNIGAAIENMTLRAIEMGYGSCWLTSANYASNEIKEFLNKTSVQLKATLEGYDMAALLTVGEPQEPNKTPAKKGVEEVSTLLE